MKYFLYALVVLSLSCKSKKVVAQDLPENQPVLLVQDNYSGAEDSENIIIKNRKVLHSFFAQVNKTRKPGIAVPEIDFNREMVIVVCAGKSNSSVMPNVVLMEENQDSITLKVNNERTEKPNSTAVTSPFRLYKMPLTQKAISFK